MRERLSIDRRTFLVGSGVTGGALAFAGGLGLAIQKPRIKAIAFDAFPIFDPRPIFANAKVVVPDYAEEFVRVWRARQFEYTWLRVLSGRYAGFWNVTEDALHYASTLFKLNLSEDDRAKLMSAYLHLTPWPDVPQGLRMLKGAGLKLALLSNFTPRMLKAGIASSGLEKVFDHALSTDMVKTYKPDPHAYQIGVDAFGLPREEILFVAFAGWDASGAKAFGYPTYWINRMGLPPEKLDDQPDGIGSDLNDLVRFLGV